MSESEDNSRSVQRLLDNSLEAFLLAIELYNRPTAKYRVESFSFFICNAWELMLKAKLIKDKGIDAIYYNGSDRTISLEKCIDLVFTNHKDPLSRNLKSIIQLRNTSVHFIVEEYEQIYAGLFQACVNNFDEKLFEFHGVSLSDRVPHHLLMLSMPADPIDIDTIRLKYSPDVAEKFLFNEAKIRQQEAENENGRYSILLRTEVAIVKDRSRADFTVSIDPESDKPATIISEFKDPKNTHPFTVSSIVEQINRRLKRAGIVLEAGGVAKNFTKNDWALFMKFYDFKQDDQYGYAHRLGNKSSSIQYTYSQKTIDFIFDLIRQNPKNVIDILKNKQKKKNET